MGTHTNHVFIFPNNYCDLDKNLGGYYPCNLQTLTEFIWFLELQIVRGCGGFPLALKVIGGSLRGQHPHVWKRRLMDLSDGQCFFNSETDMLLASLQKSLEFPKDKITIKECFMDLGAFPDNERIPAAALIDMWAELYELDEYAAIANLLELTTQNLASLVMERYAGLLFYNIFSCSVTSSCYYSKLLVVICYNSIHGRRPKLFFHV